ncbi:MAG: carbohydrate ABC transporter permease [Ruthenibacterium sp.]
MNQKPRANSKRLKTHNIGIALGSAIGWVAVWTFFLIIVIPMLWMVISSFKETNEIFDNIWGLPRVWQFGNYLKAWNSGISKYFLNSVIVTICTVLLTLTLCALYAYSMAVYQFKGKKFFFIFAMAGMMFSPIVSMIPLYQEVQALGLYNNLLSLILIYAAYQMAMSFLLIHNFFVDIDKAYLDAAKIDGCTDLGALKHIYIPMSIPVFLTSAVLTGFYAWNEFSFALVFIKQDALKTIPVGLLAFQGEMHSEWAVLLAGLTLSAIPIIIFFMFTQKYFIAGLSAGGVKG